MQRLSKIELKKRWLELRSLWNEYDPIGVYESESSDWPPDEYEAYCGPCMRLLEQKASDLELEAVVYAALDRMGLEGNEKNIKTFVKKMQKWFKNNWADKM